MAIDVIVAVPAHDETDRIANCLESVVVAATAAIADGTLGRVLVAVAAHRCSDDTAERARSALQKLSVTWPSGISGVVRPDENSATVGDVRARLIRHAACRAQITPGDWIFNTDADSVVPADWITATLRQAEANGASAVAGLVSVTGWAASARARQQYRKILRMGMTDHGHRHVYGANLAVRWDAYQRAGGFATVTHGEDTQLIQQLRKRGEQIITTFTPVVNTSGRVPGRAEHGLGELLGRLEV